MILISQIIDIIANENVRCKRWSFDAVTQRFLHVYVEWRYGAMQRCYTTSLSRPCTEVNDKVIHALANLRIPLFDRQEMHVFIFDLLEHIIDRLCLPLKQHAVMRGAVV